MPPKLSIIVTSYNIEKYIGECLESIIKQTIEDIEIIVVDDGSTDRTPEIIQKYAKIDGRVTPMLMLYNSIGGVATPANIGINAAQGDYIGFADGDDIYDLETFEKLYISAKENKADISMCTFMDFEQGIHVKNNYLDPYWNEVSSLKSLDISIPENKRKILRLLPVPWRKLYKRDFLVKNNLYFPVSEYFFEDNGFHWLVTLNANKVSFVDEILCYHRCNRVGQTISFGGKRLLGVFHQHTIIYNYLHHHKLLKAYKKDALMWLFLHVFWLGKQLDPKYSHDFYKIASRHFGKYSANEIRSLYLEGSYSRKDLELLVSLLSKNENYFVKIMYGRLSLNIKDKLMFNYHRLGLINLIDFIIKYYKNMVINKIKPKVTKTKTNELLLDCNRKIDHMSYRIDNIERMIEIGFILSENSKNKKK